MANAGKTVYVEIVAQTKKFNAGLKKADKGLAKTRKAVGLVSAAIVTLGAVALRGVSREINEISKELDGLAKTARALGTEFNFLEDLQFVSKRLGANASTETLKKTMLAISKATGEALTGSAEYVDEFAALGLEVKKFNKLDPEGKFFALQNAYSASAKGAKEQNALQIIAGRGAKALLNVFDAETESVVDLIRERRKLGGFTEDAGNLAETFEDVKTNTDQVIRGLKNSIFLSVGPSFIKAAEAVQEFVLWLRETGLVGPVVKGALLAITIAMGAATAAGITLLATLSPIAVTAGIVGAALVGIGLGLYTLITRWDELTESIKYFAQHFNSLKDNFVTGFGGEVLRVLGFGDDDSLAQSAGAPAAGGSSTSTDNSSKTVVTNNYAPGQTPSQQRSEARRREGAALRGKRK